MTDPQETGGFQGQRQEIENQLNFLRYSESRDPLTELLVEGDAHQVLLATRFICNKFERDVAEERTPDMYSYNIKRMLLGDRIAASGYIYPLFPTKIVVERDKDKLVEREVARPGLIADAKERKAFRDSLQRTFDEMVARGELTQKLWEQMAYRWDIDVYADQMFKRVGKEIIATRNYKVIFESPPTADGFVPFGDKVAAGISLLRSIGEGNAGIEDENGEVKYLPNLFAMPANWGLWRIAVDNYLLPKLVEMRSGTSERFPAGTREALVDLENFDDEAALLVALELFRHWDLDVKYAFAVKLSGGAAVSAIDRNRMLSGDEFKDIKLETGSMSRDHAKFHLEVRRALEWGRKGEGASHEHVRRAGNPMTFGCYPSLVITALDVMPQEIEINEKAKQGIERELRDKGIKDDLRIPFNFTLSIHDCIFGNDRLGNTIEIPVEIGKRDKDDKFVKERTEIVKRQFNYWQFKGIDWDGAQFSDREIDPRDSDPSVYHFTMGPNTEAFEVPYKLAIYYLFTGIFNQVMREDYLKQYQEATAVGDANLLLKMNKAIDIAFFMLSRGYRLTQGKDKKPGTMEKLNNYIRAVFLGSLAAAVSVESNAEQEPTLEKGMQVSAGKSDYSQAAGPLLQAAGMHAFLPHGDKNDSVYGFVEEDWAKLVIEIAKNRKAPLPGDCMLGGKPLFEKYELAELVPLYPLGLSANK